MVIYCSIVLQNAFNKKSYSMLICQKWKLCCKVGIKNRDVIFDISDNYTCVQRCANEFTHTRENMHMCEINCATLSLNSVKIFASVIRLLTKISKHEIKKENNSKK